MVLTAKKSKSDCVEQFVFMSNVHVMEINSKSVESRGDEVIICKMRLDGYDDVSMVKGPKPQDVE